ncbi:hypothetical protein MMC28_002401 [Mycoblastus sanguinarius]|nr:hypothetical protein [Mycoblastus sanguinarius]
MLEGMHPLPASRIDPDLGLQTPYIENNAHTDEFLGGSSRSSTPMPASILQNATEHNPHFHNQHLHSASNYLTKAATAFENHNSTPSSKTGLGSLPRNERLHYIPTKEFSPNPLTDSATGAIYCHCKDIFTHFDPGTSRGKCRVCSHQFCGECYYM